MNDLLKNANFVRVSAGGAGSASATPTKATILDMSGYQSVLFIAEFGHVLDTAVVSLKAGVSDTNDTATMTLLTDFPTGTAGAATYDDKMVILSIPKVDKRYVEAQVFHVTADAPFDSVIAIQYNPTNVPVTQGSTVVNSATALD